MNKSKKSYLITLTWSGIQKRFRFVGLNDDVKFKNISKELNQIGDNASSSKDFFEKAIDMYSKDGYEWMPL